MRQETYEWSFAPRESYQVEFMGRALGIGLHPALLAFPGAWNLLNLTCSILDNILPWTKDPGEFPINITVLPAIVGTALQLHPEGRGMTYGELALINRPLQFMKLIQNCDDLIVEKIYGKEWRTVARQRAAELEATCNRGIIKVDFKARQQVH